MGKFIITIRTPLFSGNQPTKLSAIERKVVEALESTGCKVINRERTESKVVLYVSWR